MAKRCVYCMDEDRFGKSIMEPDIVKMHGYPVLKGDLFIDGGLGRLMLYIGNHYEICISEFSKKIKYCPMCGRKLSNKGE